MIGQQPKRLSRSSLTQIIKRKENCFVLLDETVEGIHIAHLFDVGKEIAMFPIEGLRDYSTGAGYYPHIMTAKEDDIELLYLLAHEYKLFLIFSENDIDTVANHFHKFTYANLPWIQKIAWFRFYDPLVFYPFLRCATKEQLSSFFVRTVFTGCLISLPPSLSIQMDDLLGYYNVYLSEDGKDDEIWPRFAFTENQFCLLENGQKDLMLGYAYQAIEDLGAIEIRTAKETLSPLIDLAMDFDLLNREAVCLLAQTWAKNRNWFEYTIKEQRERLQHPGFSPEFKLSYLRKLVNDLGQI